MKLRTCIACGGPRRSLTVEVCAKCRKHHKDSCPDCGQPKGAVQARCRSCNMRVVNHERRDPDRPPPPSVINDCPDCGGRKRASASRCWDCHVALIATGHRLCPLCGGNKSPRAKMCHGCRFGRERRHGWTAGSDGRVRIYRGGNRYEFRARMVARAVLGRDLAPNEVVHHINGVKNDDRPVNLIVLTTEAHTALHHAQGDIRH